MDTALNLHNIYLDALAKAFPNEFDEAFVKHKKKSNNQNYAEIILGEKIGGKVLIVGGDNMASKEEIMDRQILEGIRIKK